MHPPHPSHDSARTTKVIFLLRALGAILGFVAASIYGLGIAFFRRDRSQVARDYARRLHRWMQIPLGFRLEIEGEEHLYETRPCIYLVNHQSYFDAPVLAGLYPDRTVVIGKKELRWIPLFGWLFAVTGNIFIDRSEHREAVQRLREVAAAVRERRLSVWIFPEGTRGRTPGTLLRFKKGAFHMAIDAQVPLVPIVVSPTQELFDLARGRLRTGTIQVRVLAPIRTEGLGEEDVDALLAEARGRMAASLAELRTTVD